MTSKQRTLIMPLLLAISNANTIDQVIAIWQVLKPACAAAGMTIGNVPTSLPQAKSMANALRNRI